MAKPSKNIAGAIAQLKKKKGASSLEGPPEKGSRKQRNLKPKNKYYDAGYPNTQL